MSNRYQLVGLKNEELLHGVSRLVAQANELTADVLAHLVEVEARLLHAELGFPNPDPAPVSFLLRPPPPHLPRSQEVQPTAAARYKVQFTADAKLRDLIERACALCPNHSSQGQLALVVTRGLELYVSQQEKRHFALGRRPRKSRPPKAKAKGAVPDKWDPQSAPPGGVKPTRTSEDPQSAPPGGVTQNVATDAPLPALPDRVKRRSIKAAERRIVHERDQGRCSSVSPHGRRCAERARLQFDHVQPWSTRGGEDAANLRLLCPTHNRLHARHCFGERHIQAKIAARRAAARTTSVSRRC